MFQLSQTRLQSVTGDETRCAAIDYADNRFYVSSLMLVGDGYVEAEVGRLTYQVEGYGDACEDFGEGER